jgi:hypothetical protein
MAIHQHDISLIPKQSIVDRFGKIPSKLFIDHESRINHVDTKNFDDEISFQDDLTINYWKNHRLKFSDIESYIDASFKLIEWTKESEDFKSFGDYNDNDMSVSFNADNFISGIDFRINVANLNNDVLSNVLILTRYLDCLLVDKQGNLFEPSEDNLIRSINKSNAFKFNSNPKDFLDKLSSGEIKPE